MRNIAFLSFDWDYEVMSAYYQGMALHLDEVDDCRVVIFNTFGIYDDFNPQIDALEFFSLCDLEAYDGFIVQGNRVWPPVMRQELCDHLADMGKPVVSVNYSLRNTCMVGTDNYLAMKGLVLRVMRDQHCIRPAFVNGLVTSVEAQARAHAYLSACDELGIEEPVFIQADWQIESGIEAAKQLLASPDELPDVVFCCNDDIAAGVQQTLQEAGVRVPEDVKVTGFDNRENSLRATPRITTVDRDYIGIGYTALSAMLSMLDTGKRYDCVPSDVHYVLSYSSGYSYVVDEQDKGQAVEDFYSMDHALKLFYQVLMNLEPVLLSADTIEQVLTHCERYLPELRCSQAYLTLNQNYLDAWLSGATDVPFGKKSKLGACMRASQELPLSCGDDHFYATFESTRLVPDPLMSDSKLILGFPIRRGKINIGALFIEGFSPAMHYGFLTFMLSLIASALEGVRQKAMLHTMNERLDDLYTHDQLTGLHNRFGLEQRGVVAYERILKAHGMAYVTFVDVDNMKGINDRYGHDQGDQALVDTACIIQWGCSGSDAFEMRYGGDEFLVISSENLIPQMTEELKRFRDTAPRPYRLSLSMGSYPVHEHEQCPVKEAIQRADQRMYEKKRALKGSLACPLPPRKD